MFIWPTYQKAPRRFLESALKISQGSLASYMVQFMFAYVENTFFSEQWWSSLAEEERRHLAGLAAIGNAYYTTFSYIPNQIVPWEIVEANIEDIV